MRCCCSDSRSILRCCLGSSSWDGSGKCSIAAPGDGVFVAVYELSPADIEAEFGMAGGHWHHAELCLDQFLMLRPVPVLPDRLTQITLPEDRALRITTMGTSLMSCIASSSRRTFGRVL